MTARRPLRLDALQLVVLAGLLAAAAYAVADLYALTRVQAAGADYSCFWAGARTALSDPARIYDFQHNTVVQGWPLGPGRLRPYIYPPTALLLFAPFTLPGYWTGYGLWVALTGALFLWAARRTGAPWLLVLLTPAVALVAFCGQVTFLMGGLVLAGLSLRRRPILAGVLFGIAAAIKPQFMLLVPLALIAEGRWRTLVTAGVAGLLLCTTATLVWGPQIWLDWLAALPRFNQLIFHDRGLTEDAVTPYAALVASGLAGGWASLLAPFAAALVWFGFRRTEDLADRSLLLFGATLLVTPYAMNYELALFAPGLAVYLSRWRDPRWSGYGAAAFGYVLLPWAFPTVLPALALPIASLLRPRLAHDARTETSSIPRR
jgi:uncharacterized membrane protein YhaH (DUF805 family)